MQIVICAATQIELLPLMQLTNNAKLKHEIVFLVHGIGCAISSALISKAMLQYNAAFFIQIGIAGSFSTNIQLAEVFIIQNDFLGNQGVWENNKWLTLNNLQLTNKQPEPFNKSINFFNKDAIKYAEMLKLQYKNAVTVSEITTQQIVINNYTLADVSLETMEGAALHLNAILHNKNYVQLRGVSNFIGERNKANWKINEAITQVNNAAWQLLNML